MKVTTSDNKTIDNFEGFLSVVGTIQKAINPTQSKQNIGSSFSKLTMGSEYSSISSSSSGLTTPTQLLANRRALIESELISQKPLSGSATKETIESVLVSGLIKKVLTPLKKERVESLTMELIKEETFEKIRIYFPKSRGMPRVDDLRVVSGIVYVLRNGLRWKDAPKSYGPPKTLYNRFIRWSRMGVFARILQKLVKEKTEILMIDATHLKAHRTTASLKGGLRRGTLEGQREDLGANCTPFAMALEGR